MTVSFTLATKTRNDMFRDNASINDVVKYEFDLTPWQDDNSQILSVDWSNTGGNSAGISGQTLNAGIASALVTFSQSGNTSLKLVITTATQKKTIWLKVKVADRSRDNYAGDDYGYGT